MHADGDRAGRTSVALSLAHPRPGGTVVDWGCGNGNLARQLAAVDPSIRVLACDITPPSAAPELPANCTYVAIDDLTPRLPLDDGAADVVYLLDVLEHMGDASRPRALAEMRRVLGPGGVLVVTVPHRGALHWTDVENVRFRFPRAHRAVYTLVRGRARYRERYGSNRLFNFSSDAVEHHHYSTDELHATLSAGGFVPTETVYFGLLYIGVWALSVLLEGGQRVTGRRASRADARLERLYRASVSARPPRSLADSIGVAATPGPPSRVAAE